MTPRNQIGNAPGFRIPVEIPAAYRVLFCRRRKRKQGLLTGVGDAQGRRAAAWRTSRLRSAGVLSSKIAFNSLPVLSEPGTLAIGTLLLVDQSERR